MQVVQGGVASDGSRDGHADVGCRRSFAIRNCSYKTRCRGWRCEAQKFGLLSGVPALRATPTAGEGLKVQVLWGKVCHPTKRQRPCLRMSSQGTSTLSISNPAPPKNLRPLKLQRPRKILDFFSSFSLQCHMAFILESRNRTLPACSGPCGLSRAQ
ncbi:hypothetical protein GQ53DRAFT_408079 [Thozetella sp. PMI_491]|nr:hypothetical protein GQ53DRAFT_408079 [Thozetella sp. PMI_491]